MADTIGKVNPFLYRGYYYDSETGLFFVGSRYYDPQTGRFINADDIDTLTATPTELTDKNLFAYCDNNPVIRADDDGHFWYIIIGAAAGAAFSVGWQMIVEHKSISQLNPYDIVSSAISGGLAASGLGLAWQVGLNAALGGVSSAASGGDILDIGVSASAGFGLASGFIGGRGANCKGALKTALSQSKIRIKGQATTLAKKVAKKLATKTRKIGKKAVKKIITSAVARSVIGTVSARYGYSRYGYYSYAYYRRHDCC